MNKTLAISAITIFAVMLGMSAIAPVLADPPERNKVFICHYQTKDKTIDEVFQPAGWYPQEVSVKSLQKHLNHEDQIITNSDGSIGTITEQGCLDRNL